ncbi:MAG: histidinol-phosphatase HisJ [Clostridium sp.]|nr:histidinol-phosphatase HisJ [Clostridium sp.]
MILSNFHTHCFFCDGNGNPSEYVKKAIEFNFNSIGFSSHAPLPFSNDWTMKPENLPIYLESIKNLKDLYHNTIEIYTGLEIDYIKNLMCSCSKKFLDLNLDYTIGSIHMLKDLNGGYLAVDGDLSEYEALLKFTFNNDIKQFVHEYYSQVRNMVIESTPSIVGHLDLIKKHNKAMRFFNENESWYKEEIIETLKTISNSNSILEINTGGKVRGYTEDFYPSNWIIRESRKLNIPIILNSDAHDPMQIKAYFKEASEILKASGYTYQHILKNNKWTEVPL